MRSGRRSLTALSWALLVAVGCEERPVADPLPDVPVADVELLQPPLSLGGEPAVVVGGARDTLPGQNLYLVRAALLLEHGGLLLATDGSQSILEYDSRGDFVAQHGGPGEGPGEYRRIREIHPLRGDTLAIWDHAGRRITYLDHERQVAGTVSLAPIRENDPHIVSTLELRSLANGAFLAATRPLNGQAHRRGSGYSRDVHYLAVLDRAGRETASIGMVAGHEWYTNRDGDRAVSSPFSYSLYLAAADSAFYVGDGRGPYLTEYSETGTARRRLALPIQRVPITDSAWRESLDEYLARWAPQDRAETAELQEQALIVDSFPAYVALESGRDGALWVRLRTPPDAAQRWLVVDPQAGTAREIELPPDGRVLAATAERVAILQQDEWEREEVRVYKIVEATLP